MKIDTSMSQLIVIYKIRHNTETTLLQCKNEKKLGLKNTSHWCCVVIVTAIKIVTSGVTVAVR